MKPALSVIFFTVGSGAGFGLFVLLVAADLLGWSGPLSAAQFLGIGGLALALIGGGLFSSTLHLANPKNAWRAFSRFKTSWLSREGWFAVLFFPPALAYLASGWAGQGGTVRAVTGVVAVLLAWLTVYSTGMIYACLKTIRQWNSPLVPALYLVFAHFSGALLLLAALRLTGGEGGAIGVLALGLLALAALLKAIYWLWIHEPTQGPSINTATGLTRAGVRLLDPGHSHGTFLTHEFGFRIAREQAALLKGLTFGLGFGVPVAVLAIAGNAAWGAATAAACGLAGLLVERWLFFAEAQHVVRLYHGQQRC